MTTLTNKTVKNQFSLRFKPIKRLFAGIALTALTVVACKPQEPFNPNKVDANDTDTRVVKQVTKVQTGNQVHTQTQTMIKSDDGRLVPTSQKQTYKLVSTSPVVGKEHPAIVSLKSAAPELGLFAQLLVKADLMGLLQDSNTTLFAPTNAALNALPPEEIAYLSSHKARLLDFLRGHVLQKRMSLQQLKDARNMPVSMLGVPFTLTRFEDGRFFVQSAQVISPDLNSNKALVHVVDRLLVMPGN